MKDDYKTLYYEELIEQSVNQRFTGWLTLSVFSLATIALWIFGVWSFNDKLLWTGITIFIVFVFGYFPIKNANKAIKMHRKEMSR
jgi:hypothetical protein